MIDFKTGYMPDIRLPETQESNELCLYIANTGQIYRKETMPIMVNLARKIVKGIYRPELGLKAFENLASVGACNYNQEFGNGWSTKGFSKIDRMVCALELMSNYQEQIQEKVNELTQSKQQPTRNQKSR